MEDIPLKDGLNFPLPFAKALRKTSYYNWLYKNHMGHHVMSGRVNYNVCCPGMDQILGTYVPEAEWHPRRGCLLAPLTATRTRRVSTMRVSGSAPRREWSRLSSSRARSWRWSSGKILFFILIVSRATRR